MKRLLSLFFILISFSSFSQIGVDAIHCGYDFTSYFVIYPHEDGKTKTTDNLRISITDAEGNDAINHNNSLSWVQGGKPLVFRRNYKIDSGNKRLPEGSEDGKWFFYFAQDHYLLSVSNTFPAEQFFIKVEDSEGRFKTQIIPLASYNMYVLCSNEERDKVIQFGRRVNKPIDVVLEKK